MESKLLLDEYPLIVLPKLASFLGLNESIVMQQLHYWLGKSGKERDGRVWIYNTYDDWQKQFPFWSVSTIRRAIGKLEKLELIINGNFNKMSIDNTKWYSINYELFNKSVEYFVNEHKNLEESVELAKKWMNRPSAQNEQTDCSKWTDDLLNLNKPLPENTTETNNKNIITCYASNTVDVTTEEMISDINRKMNTHLKETLSKKDVDLLLQQCESIVGLADSFPFQLKSHKVSHSAPVLVVLWALSKDAKTRNKMGIELDFKSSQAISLFKTIIYYIKLFKKCPSAEEVKAIDNFLTQKEWTPAILYKGMLIAVEKEHTEGFNKQITPYLQEALKNEKTKGRLYATKVLEEKTQKWGNFERKTTKPQNYLRDLPEGREF